MDGTGEVISTFMFTDIVGSTALWEADHVAMAAALEAHDKLIVDTVAVADGTVVKHTGDGFLAAFADPAGAVHAAVDIVRRMATHEWRPAGLDLHVRIGIHTGLAHGRDDDFFGPGVSVTARLTAIAQGDQILVSEATRWRCTTIAESDFRWLGTVRLRGVDEPVGIHQVLGRGLPHTFPAAPAVTKPIPPPAVTTSLVGRDSAAEQLTQRLRQHRVVTLVGTGGVGKTRLATHLASPPPGNVADVVWWCDLSEITKPESVERALLMSAGLGRGDSAPAVEQLVSVLGAPAVLIVIDNAEHVVAAVARVCAELLTRSPSVRLLVTSREPLGIVGECVVVLDPLDLDSAVSLFGERAIAVNHAFTISESNVAAVADLCQRLDGLPLAIELAAARTRSLSVNDLARLIDDRYRLVRDESAGARSRQSSVEATVAWSWDLLGPEDQDVFAALATFAGPFDLDAAHAVTARADEDEIDTADRLDRFVRRSLLDAVHGEDTRYRLLETVRSFGRSQLRTRGEADVRRRWSSYFVAFAQRIAWEVNGPRAAPSIQRATAQIGQLRAVFQWAMATGQVDVALDLVSALGDYAFERMQVEIGEWAQIVVASPDVDRRNVRWPSAVAVAATGAWLKGEMALGRSLADAGLEQAPRNQELSSVAALLSLYEGDLTTSRHQYELTLDLALEANDSFHAARRWGELGFVSHLLGDASAVDSCERSMKLAKLTGSTEAQAHALWAYGAVVARSSPDLAAESLRQSMDLALTVDARLTWNASATVLEPINNRQLGKGSRQPALAVIRRARDWTVLGRSPAQWGAIRSAVRMLLRLGYVEAAARLHGAAEEAGVTELRDPMAADSYSPALAAARRAVGERPWQAEESAGRHFDQAGLRAFLDEIEATLMAADDR